MKELVGADIKKAKQLKERILNLEFLNQEKSSNVVAALELSKLEVLQRSTFKTT